MMKKMSEEEIRERLEKYHDKVDEEMVKETKKALDLKVELQRLEDEVQEQ